MTIKGIARIINIAPRFSQGPKFLSTAAKPDEMRAPLVTVQQGQLKGAVKHLLNGSPYFSFKGIPYASQPLRFRDPLPPKAWTGTYEAIEHGPVCPQYDMTIRQNIEGDENCFFLNVYTRDLQSNSKLPVMVYIHGGAYMSGSGNADAGLGPEFLLQHDVILVTINYRLETFGFLTLDTPEVPGNAGMKDQVFALRWVQENISQFGGDPDNVTLFGESAGACSLTFHMYSQMSKGLFHKGIAQSGSMFNDYAFARNGRERAFRLGKAVGKETNDENELLQYLRNVPPKKLMKQTLNVMTYDEKHRGLPINFAPVTEKKFHGVEAFITEDPIDLLAKKITDIPLMMGYCSQEGLIMLPDQIKKLEFINKHLGFLVPRELAAKLSEDKMKEFGERLIKFYFGKSEITANDRQQFTSLLTDKTFLYNIQRFAHLYSANGPTYLFKFSLDTDLNILKAISGVSDLEGACHVDDLFYLFCSEINKDIYEEQEKLQKIVYDVTKLWTNFAKTGNPTPDGSSVLWPPYTAASRSYLDIAEPMRVGQSPDKDRFEFWDKLYSEAGLSCITKSNL